MVKVLCVKVGPCFSNRDKDSCQEINCLHAEPDGPEQVVLVGGPRNGEVVKALSGRPYLLFPELVEADGRSCILQHVYLRGPVNRSGARKYTYLTAKREVGPCLMH